MQRVETANLNFNDFKGIVHVHTSQRGHGTGRFAELIKGAAAANNLDFVVMTEHTDPLYDTSALTLHEVYNDVLFVGGQEVPTATDLFCSFRAMPKPVAPRR